VMRKSQGSLERLEAAMRLANPVPHPSALADSSESLAVSRLVSRRRHAMRPEPTASPEARHHWRGIAIAAAAFAAALAIALPLWLLRGGDEPPAVATSVTTTITASTIATTTTTAATATQEIVVASISVEDASPSVGGPLVAVSAREAWLGMTPSAESGTTLIGHLEDGTWSFYRLDRLRNWMAGILGLAVAPDGMVWAATNVGVFSFDGAEWTRRFDGPAGAVVVDQGGTVWIGGGRLGEVPGFPAGSALDDDGRRAIGRLHPDFLGGQYLPDLSPSEVMIARITIASTARDVTSVYARRGRSRIHYRVVDEYEGDTLSEKRTRTSTRPLTLGQLETFFNGAWPLLAVLDMNFADTGYDLGEMPRLVDVDSQFCPDLEELYVQRITSWSQEQQTALELDQGVDREG